MRKLIEFVKNNTLVKWIIWFLTTIIAGLVINYISFLYIPSWISPNSKNTIESIQENKIENFKIVKNIFPSNEITIITDNDGFEEKISKIKNDYNIRELLPLEAWKSLKNTPNNTYFWINDSSLIIYDDINKWKTKNIKTSNYDFEVMYINDKLYILWFTSDNIVSNIMTYKSLIIKPNYFKDLSFNTLVVIPLEIIKNKESRWIWIKENNINKSPSGMINTWAEKTQTKVYDITLK